MAANLCPHDRLVYVSGSCQRLLPFGEQLHPFRPTGGLLRRSLDSDIAARSFGWSASVENEGGPLQ